MTQGEVGAYLQSHLRRKGIDTVLSGGAAVALYPSGRYVTHDVDLVNKDQVRRALIRSALEELGFREEGRHFHHPETQFLVEFPPGPLSVGDQTNPLVEEIHLDTGILRVISPTDSVMDRLAWYYHSGDRQCLSQAVLIAQQQKVDLDRVAKWSRSEGKRKEFAIFKKSLAK